MREFLVVHFQQEDQRKKAQIESIPCGIFSTGGIRK